MLQMLIKRLGKNQKIVQIRNSKVITKIFQTMLHEQVEKLLG